MEYLDTLERMREVLIRTVKTLMVKDPRNYMTFGVAVLIDGDGKRIGFASGLYRNTKTPHAEVQILNKLEKWVNRLRQRDGAVVVMLVEIDACGPENKNCRGSLRTWANRNRVPVDFYQLVTATGNEGKAQIRNALKKGSTPQVFKALKESTFVPEVGVGAKEPKGRGQTPQKTTAPGKASRTPVRPSISTNLPAPKAATPLSAQASQRALNDPKVNRPPTGRPSSSSQGAKGNRLTRIPFSQGSNLLRGVLRILSLVGAVAEPIQLLDFLRRSERKLAGGSFVLDDARKEAERIRTKANDLRDEYTAFSKSLEKWRWDLVGPIAGASGRQDLATLREDVYGILDVIGKLSDAKNKLAAKARSVGAAAEGLGKRITVLDSLLHDPATSAALSAAGSLPLFTMLRLDLDPVAGAVSNARDVLNQVVQMIDTDIKALNDLNRSALSLAGELL
jgi:hypothetical protein